MDKRIFLAIKINPEPELLEIIDLMREELADESIKWVDETQYHITLKFFGSIHENKIATISSIVKNFCSHTGMFSFDLTCPWYFRDREQLRVVLLQTTNTDVLLSFQNQLGNAFFDLGIPKEDRIFKPHLTLGRIKSIRDSRHFYELMKQFPYRTVQTVCVKEIILFESILKPTGPDYRVIEKFRLIND